MIRRVPIPSANPRRLPAVLLVLACLLLPRVAAAGFCHGGATPQTAWPDEGAVVVGSYCPGTGQTGSWTSPPFNASRNLHLQVGGHLDRNTLRLELERVSDGARERLLLAEDPAGHARDYYFALPRAWRNTPLRLVGTDEESAPDGWCPAWRWRSPCARLRGRRSDRY